MMEYTQNIEEYKNKWFNFVKYEPHSGQKKLHFPPNGVYNAENNPDGTRYTVVSAGRRFGKSFSAAREIEIQLCIPNSVCWIIAPNYATSSKIFEFVYTELVIQKGYKPSRYSAKDQYLEFDWNGGKSVLEGKSAEFPNSMIGEGVSLAVFDEASKIKGLKKIWEMYVRPTLSDGKRGKGRAIFISTPQGHNYFYRLFLKGQNEANWYSFNSPSWDNRHSFPEGEEDLDLLEAKQSLTDEIFRQEFAAEFTSLQGRVYNDFSRNENVGKYPYRYNLPTFISIDFGYRSPAVLWFQTERINDVDHIYFIDEIVHQTNIKTTELVDMIKQRPYQIANVYGDPAGYQVQASVGKGEADIFYQNTGWRVFAVRDKASRSIASGVSHVRNFILSSDGTRRLHIDEKCTGLIEDMEGYAYPESKEGYEMKELPKKDGYHDHSMDALRYALVNQFPIRQYQIQFRSR